MELNEVYSALAIFFTNDEKEMGAILSLISHDCVDLYIPPIYNNSGIYFTLIKIPTNKVLYLKNIWSLFGVNAFLTSAPSQHVLAQIDACKFNLVDNQQRFTLAVLPDELLPAMVGVVGSIGVNICPSIQLRYNTKIQLWLGL
jgi:hypothetical protein